MVYYGGYVNKRTYKVRRHRKKTFTKKPSFFSKRLQPLPLSYGKIRPSSLMSIPAAPAVKASRALAIANKAITMAHSEWKYNNITASAINTSTTPAFVLLNGLNLGDTASSRDGQKITMRNLLFRCSWIINSAVTSSTICRIILFIDYQANGAAPSASDILQTSTNVLSPLVVGNGDRFRILRDRRVVLNKNGNDSKQYQQFIPLDKINVKYNTADNGTIADIITGSLYMLHMSDQGTNIPTISYYARLRWTDN